jgi:hypothetical protein
MYQRLKMEPLMLSSGQPIRGQIADDLPVLTSDQCHIRALRRWQSSDPVESRGQ